MYAIGKSTVAEIVHHHSSRQACYRGNSFPNWARIGPGDGRFWRFVWFAMLCWSFGWHIHAHEKPSEFGDTYFCYKKFTAIIVLACVDARGIFTYVNAGRPGSVGDS